MSYPLIGVSRKKEGNLSSPVPAFRNRWSQLRKLRWHAEIAELDAGLPPGTIKVRKGRSWVNGKFQYGLFEISLPGIGTSPTGFEEAWTLINGICLGVSSMKKVAK